MYDSSPRKLIMDNFHDHNWQPWRFNQQERLISDLDVVRKYVAILEKEFDISDPQDWNTISPQKILEHGTWPAIHKAMTMGEILQKVYPDHVWHKQNKR